MISKVGKSESDTNEDLHSFCEVANITDICMVEGQVCALHHTNGCEILRLCGAIISALFELKYPL